VHQTGSTYRFSPIIVTAATIKYPFEVLSRFPYTGTPKRLNLDKLEKLTELEKQYLGYKN